MLASAADDAPVSASVIQRRLSTLAAHYSGGEGGFTQPPSLPTVIREAERLRDAGLLHEEYGSATHRGGHAAFRYAVTEKGRGLLAQSSLAETVARQTADWTGEAIARKRKETKE